MGGCQMIVMHGTKPVWGLPQASPFAVKVEVLLKMAGLPHEVVAADFRKAPKGKIPWIVDGGVVVADSRLIRRHLETQHGADFSGGYGARDQAIGLAFERMMENHLYWFNVENRWLDAANFARGPAHLFDKAPAPVRPILRAFVMRRLKRDIAAEGLAKLSVAEKQLLVSKALAAISGLIGAGDFALGPRPSGTDATVFAFLATLEAPFFASAYGDMVRADPVLMAYLARMRALFYPS